MIEFEQSVEHLLASGGAQGKADRRPMRRRHADTGGRCRREIPTDGLGIEPELGGDPLLRQALAAEPKDFPDFDHGDLAIHPRLLAPERGPESETSIARSDERGKGFESLARQGGNGFENLTPEGGRVLKRSSGKGP
jgi:hypothetical protein